MKYYGLLNLVPPPLYQIIQRDVRSGDPQGRWQVAYGRGWGTLGLTISPTAAVQLLEVRVRDAGAPTARPLLDWTPCGTNVAAGPLLLEITLPARTGWYLIDLRAELDDSSVASTSAVGMGEVIAATGQSLASDFWSTTATGDPATLASCGVVPSNFGTCLAAWDGSPPPSLATAWSLPGDTSAYRSAFCAEFLRLAIGGTGVNCGLVGYGWSGEPISSWSASRTGPKDVWSPLTATLDRAVGQGRSLGTLIWMHGHNDARIAQAGVDGDELTSDQYTAALGAVISSLAARYGRIKTYRLLSSIPAIGQNWVSANPKFSAAFIQQIRSAHLSYAKTDPLVLGHVDGLDVPLWSDETHPSQIGNIVLARHFYRAFMRGQTGSSYTAGDGGPSLDGYGSRAPGASRVFLRLSSRRNIALACSGGPSAAASQFQVFRAGSTAFQDAFQVSAVDLLPSGVLMISLTPTPSDSQALDVWYRLPPDSIEALLPGGQLYDDNTDELSSDGLVLGRQLAMRPIPVRIPAPTLCGPILVGPGVPLLTSSAAIALGV